MIEHIKIVILEGSPHKNGSSNILAEQFIKGAAKAGHTVTVLDVAHYQKLCRYMHFEDQGMVLGTGCGTPVMTGNSPYMEEAYQLGKSV